jgi:hypothetical protein
MTIFSNTIKIQHLTVGIILNETFVNPVQFKLFLKMVNGCLFSKEDLTFFNGENFFIHVPYSILKESLITTTMDFEPTTDQIITKSKIEQPA